MSARTLGAGPLRGCNQLTRLPFPSSLRWWPSLFWLCAEDWALVAFPAAGGAAALYAALIGGPWAPSALLAAWAVLLSIDAGPTALVYPWDSLLLEAGALAAFLPASGAASDIAALSAPSPLLQCAHRALLARLLLGFGKLKFVGSKWSDRMYVRNFLLGQPMLSPVGLFAFKALPDIAWVFLLVGMFAVEMVLPWGLLSSSGAARVIAAASTIGLMTGIQLTGNFGYFNILTASLAVPALAVGPSAFLSFTFADAFSASARAGPLSILLQSVSGGDGRAAIFAGAALMREHPADVLFALYVIVLLPLMVMQLVMNSWINLGWAYWPVLPRLRGSNLLIELAVVAPARAFCALLRNIQQFRLVAAYGVFPPSVMPPQRWACVYETSADGKTWTRLEYKWGLCAAWSPPRFVAPYHPRLDHAVFYESTGMNGQNMLCSLGAASPYAFFAGTTPWSRLQLRLLQAGGPATNPPNESFLHSLALLVGCGHLLGDTPTSFFFTNPPAPGTVKVVRMLACRYVPLPAPIEDAGTGRTLWWKETVMGVHLPPVSLAGMAKKAGAPGEPWPLAIDTAADGPGDFWFEAVAWQRRCVESGRAPAPPTRDSLRELWAFVGDTVAFAADAHAEAVFAPAESVSASTGPFPATVIEASLATYVLWPTSTRAKWAGGAVKLPLATERILASATWEALPVVVDRVRTRFSGPRLVGIRRTLGMLTLPLTRACDHVFGDAPPSKEALAVELAAAGVDASAGAGAVYMQLGEMIQGAPTAGAHAAAVDGKGKVSADRTAWGAPIANFFGNDDVGTSGCMRNPLTWSAYIRWLVLAGGEEVVAGVLAAVTAAAGGRGEAPDFYRRLAAVPRLALFLALLPRGRPDLWVGTAPTEAGTFLTFLLSYDSVTSQAICALRMMAQSRTPGPYAPGPAGPSFLPAFLPLMPRLLAHPALRRQHAHGWSAVDGAAFLPAPAVPNWAFDEASGRWTELHAS